MSLDYPYRFWGCNLDASRLLCLCNISATLVATTHFRTELSASERDVAFFYSAGVYEACRGTARSLSSAFSSRTTQRRRSSSFYRNSPPGVRPGSGGAGCEQTYNPGGPRADLPTKHSFIELASGSRISIGVRILDGFPLGEGHNAACFKCFVNGNRISSLVVTSENWAREGICLMKIPRTGSKFIFAPGTQYETFHAETFRCDSLHAKNLGTVEVVVASGKSTGPSATFPSAPSEENLRFRTESLADKTKSHAIKFVNKNSSYFALVLTTFSYQGNVCNPSKQQLLKVEEPREYVSRFIFRTRTKEELQSLLVILRGLISEVEIEAHRWDLSQGELRRIAAD
ncbi:uncharacterized protein B0J16DRAFT_321083 [Fusarium flagelliforme]|uniref:uncharacterized protein n=1 Tax=Fusarium flagelliforme TaxID=2675880 RepID=UPI001E8EC892|nr:uncharacterized protein B0J16DRAFT_321083 [Fusarium flagelliforme]KAH7182301.1 hypothetical protein B0J16DRAFT_321083 [Fusarium flagelliforme]